VFFLQWIIRCVLSPTSFSFYYSRRGSEIVLFSAEYVCLKPLWFSDLTRLSYNEHEHMHMWLIGVSVYIGVRTITWKLLQICLLLGCYTHVTDQGQSPGHFSEGSTLRDKVMNYAVTSNDICHLRWRHFLVLHFTFAVLLPRDAMHSADYAVTRRPSVCPSVHHTPVSCRNG